MHAKAIEGYSAEAAALIPRYDAIDTAQLLASVKDFLPIEGDTLIEIGAGTGRNAAWFAAQGLHVVAVEPVKEFLDYARQTYQSDEIDWVKDELPALRQIVSRNKKFDCVLLTAVWQHVAVEDRAQSMTNLASLVADTGRLIMSVRHGPGAASRPCFACSDAEVIELAKAAGLRVEFQYSAVSIQAANQAAGVKWTWLVFARS